MTVSARDGKEIQLMVDSTDKLGNVKNKLEKAFLPIHSKLSIDGNELLNHKSATDYAIKAGSVIDLESMKITVKTPDSTKHFIKVEVKASDTANVTKHGQQTQSFWKALRPSCNVLARIYMWVLATTRRCGKKSFPSKLMMRTMTRMILILAMPHACYSSWTSTSFTPEYRTPFVNG
jgi:hypothetical protein